MKAVEVSGCTRLQREIAAAAICAEHKRLAGKDAGETELICRCPVGDGQDLGAGVKVCGRAPRGQVGAGKVGIESEAVNAAHVGSQGRDGRGHASSSAGRVLDQRDVGAAAVVTREDERLTGEGATEGERAIRAGGEHMGGRVEVSLHLGRRQIGDIDGVVEAKAANRTVECCTRIDNERASGRAEIDRVAGYTARWSRTPRTPRNGA